MKYIDADKLIAEIDKRYNEYRAKMKTDDFTYYEGMTDALDLFEQFIDYLQQEQPECVEIKCKLDNASALNSSESVDTSELLFVKQEQPQVADASKMEHEVDLEKEVKDYFMDSGYNLPYYECWTIARHFYELARQKYEK